jgi:DNA-binding transcriptional regulator YiaG
MSVGQHLRNVRTAAVLSRAEAARRARVPTSTLRNWEKDRGVPPRSAFRASSAQRNATPHFLRKFRA